MGTLNNLLKMQSKITPPSYATGKSYVHHRLRRLLIGRIILHQLELLLREADFLLHRVHHQVEVAAGHLPCLAGLSEKKKAKELMLRRS